jgi:hypothetical protein
MFMVHKTLPKKNKIEKIMQCPFIKSFYLNVVVIFYINNYAFIIILKLKWNFTQQKLNFK